MQKKPTNTFRRRRTSTKLEKNEINLGLDDLEEEFLPCSSSSLAKNENSSIGSHPRRQSFILANERLNEQLVKKSTKKTPVKRKKNEISAEKSAENEEISQKSSENDEIFQKTEENEEVLQKLAEKEEVSENLLILNEKPTTVDVIDEDEEEIASKNLFPIFNKRKKRKMSPKKVSPKKSTPKSVKKLEIITIEEPKPVQIVNIDDSSPEQPIQEVIFVFFCHIECL